MFVKEKIKLPHKKSDLTCPTTQLLKGITHSLDSESLKIGSIGKINPWVVQPYLEVELTYLFLEVMLV